MCDFSLRTVVDIRRYCTLHNFIILIDPLIACGCDDTKIHLYSTDDGEKVKIITYIHK